MGLRLYDQNRRIMVRRRRTEAKWSPILDPNTGYQFLAALHHGDLVLFKAQYQFKTLESNIERNTFSWSLDGQMIAYRKEGSLIITFIDDRETWMVADGIDETQFSWSPDGEMIAYWRGDSLFIASIASRETRKIADESGKHDQMYRQPVWAMENRALIYAGLGMLHIVSLDGSGVFTPTTQDDNKLPSLSPEKMLWSDEFRRLVIQRETYGGGYQIYLCEFSEDLRTADISLLADRNYLAGWLQPGESVLFSNGEIISFSDTPIHTITPVPTLIPLHTVPVSTLDFEIESEYFLRYNDGYALNYEITKWKNTVDEMKIQLMSLSNPGCTIRDQGGTDYFPPKRGSAIIGGILYDFAESDVENRDYRSIWYYVREIDGNPIQEYLTLIVTSQDGSEQCLLDVYDVLATLHIVIPTPVPTRLPTPTRTITPNVYPYPVTPYP